VAYQNHKQRPFLTRTDNQILRGLLTLPEGKLSGSERRAFQAMYDDLVNGKFIKLSRKQREWAEAVFLKHDLQMKPLPARVPPTKDKRKVDLNFGPLPLKPPGR
jgi:hypothetical protein